MQNLESVLDNLIESYVEKLPVRYTEYVSEWDSPIYGTVIDDDTVEWSPVKQASPLSFEDLEKALETKNAHLHLYNKAERKRRKLGHITITSNSSDELKKSLESLKDFMP